MINSNNFKYIIGLVVLLLSVTIVSNPARAELISEDSLYGTNTITLDTATGLRWLDVTLSTGISYDEILVELEPGGTFEGFHERQ